MRFSLKLKNKDHLGIHFAKSLYPLIGIVLIWRGIWYLLDEIDLLLFGQSHGWTGLIGIIVGLFLLYLPDHNLDEIHRL